DVTYGLFARNAICLPVRFASRPSIELNCWRICAAVAPAGPLSPVICLYSPLELPFLSPWTMTSYVAFGFCWMALVSALGTYALRLARPGSGEPPLLATAAAANEHMTAAVAIATPARLPPRPHNAFDRDSPREPRPQSAFERSP